MSKQNKIGVTVTPEQENCDVKDPQGYPPQRGYPPRPGNPPQSGYPPQQGHPPQYAHKQGYPPKQGNPSQSGYPPQQGHPPQYAHKQGYPPKQGNPSQYAHQQGYPPQQGYFQGQYPDGSNVIVTQPQPSNLPVTRPDDYLWFSIFVCLCCCWPIGIAAIIYSCGSQDAFAAGNVISAQEKGKTARSLNIVGVVIGLVLLVIAIARILITLKSANLS